MTNNLKIKILARVMAVTIATAGITTLSSVAFVPEAQAWSIKSAVKKVAKGAKKSGKSFRSIGRALNKKIVPVEIRNASSGLKRAVTLRLVRVPTSRDHRKPTLNPRDHRKPTLTTHDHRKPTVTIHDHRKPTVTIHDHRKTAPKVRVTRR